MAWAGRNSGFRRLGSTSVVRDRMLEARYLGRAPGRGMVSRYVSPPPPANATRRDRVWNLVEYGAWIGIVLLALLLQVIPFLLVLTMFNLAVGISSGVALAAIPVCIFGMVFTACWIASRRTRSMFGRRS